MRTIHAYYAGTVQTELTEIVTTSITASGGRRRELAEPRPASSFKWGNGRPSPATQAKSNKLKSVTFSRKLLIVLAFPRYAITLDRFRERQESAIADFQGTSKT
jgi:hypothetical protein